MKNFTLLLLFLSLSLSVFSQTASITLKKGIIMDSLRIKDKADETFALFLPSNFEVDREWPALLVFDMGGRGKKVLSMYLSAAEKEGFILVASNSIQDTTSVSANILIADRLYKTVADLLPLKKGLVYSSGFSSGAKFASIVPSFIKEVSGVISLGSAIPSYDLLTSRNAFQFIGVVGDEDFNYPDMKDARAALKRLKLPNQLWVFEGGHQWPPPLYLEKALVALKIHSMSKGLVPKDQGYIDRNYRKEYLNYQELRSNSKNAAAYDLLGEIISIYQRHTSIDSLLEQRKLLRKDKSFRSQRRDENAAFFKEDLIRDEYRFNLLEDITTLNYNNLGWWNYQVDELKKYAKKTSRVERKMGIRLLAYLNALVEDNIDIEASERPVNDEALSFLWMLKTITEPENFDYYLKIISDSSKYEDFGTALFYLEELLKQGYKDAAALYSLEHTALLRITPEFNELIKKYLQGARYEINEE